MRVFGVSVALGIIISARDGLLEMLWTLRNELHQQFFLANISLAEIFSLCQNFFSGLLAVYEFSFLSIFPCMSLFVVFLFNFPSPFPITVLMVHP